MPTDTGLWATLAVVLPLAAAAAFVLLAARVFVRRVRFDRADPRRAASGSFVGTAESYDEEAPPLGTVARQMHDALLSRERTYDQLRRTGEGAPARILDLTDTGIRIGDGASMLRFGLEVLPTGRPAFRAETQCAVSDLSRAKFTPGRTVGVRFAGNGGREVALDYAS